MKELLQEDFERNNDQILIKEAEHDEEIKYWEWFENQPKIIIEHENGEKEEILKEYRLPF